MATRHKGLGAAASGSVPPEVQFQGGSITGAATPTATYTNAPIGTASANRVILAVVARRAGNDIGVSGVTIGGVAATLAHENDPTANDRAYVSMWTLGVASGTTATVVATFDGTCDGTVMSVYSMTGVSETPSNTALATGSATTQSTTMNVLKNDVMVSAGFSDESGTGVTLVGVTEDYQANGTAGTRGQFAVGSDLAASDETSRTFSATFDGGAKCVILCAAFSP